MTTFGKTLSNRPLSRKLLRGDNAVVVMGEWRRNRFAISSPLPTQNHCNPVISIRQLAERNLFCLVIPLWGYFSGAIYHQWQSM